MFTGREFDYETGNYYYRARYYSPILGRFLQTDPINYLGGLNLYSYCRNNPLSWLDPFGLIGQHYYDQGETQNIINKGCRPGWSPTQHMGEGEYDYGAKEPFSTFDVPGRGPKNGKDFGNYAAGMFSYYNWGEGGYLMARAGGHFYAYRDAYWESYFYLRNEMDYPRYFFDDPSSIRNLREGRDDAIKRRNREDIADSRKPYNPYANSDNDPANVSPYDMMKNRNKKNKKS